MSGRFYPRAKALVPDILRSLAAVALLLIAAGCACLSLAVREAPREYWWIYWTIYAVIGLSCGLGAGWLLRMRRIGACRRLPVDPAPRRASKRFYAVGHDTKG